MSSDPFRWVFPVLMSPALGRGRRAGTPEHDGGGDQHPDHGQHDAGEGHFVGDQGPEGGDLPGLGQPRWDEAGLLRTSAHTDQNQYLAHCVRDPHRWGYLNGHPA